MSISSKLLLGTPPANNKTNPLLAGLSIDVGASARLGPDFSAMLRSTFTPPSVPPQRAPEFKPASAPKEATPRAPEPVHAKGEKAEPAQAQRSSEATAPKTKTSEGQTNDSTASSQASDANDDAKQSEDSLTAKAEVQTDETEAAKAKKDKRLEQSVNAEAARGLSVATIAINMVDPKPVMPADAQKPGVATDKLAADTAVAVAVAVAVADEARPQDLASLMPSVAKAVFGQDAGKQIVGEGKLDDKAVLTSTDERGKVMSAKAQDAAALLATQPSAADLAPKDSSAMSPELLKSFGFDKAASGDQPGFAKLMQTTGAVVGPSTAPINAAAPGSQTLAPSTPVQLRSDLQSPAFAPEMAARLTVLTSAGVQRAELHLNPAEMGPVSVQIQLNGQEAQVHFHAQHALTREVLERSLPELAAALRDAGMTLTGGGVFQQSNGDRQDAQAQRPQVADQHLTTNGPEFGGDVVAPPTIRHTQIGVLDMYA